MTFANLATVNLQKLLNKDREEEIKLLLTAQSPGFFYLDLADYDPGDVLRNPEPMYKLAKQFFEFPTEERLKYFHPGEEKGYKKEDGDVQTFEFCRDDVKAQGPSLEILPGGETKLIWQFIENSHAVAKVLLDRLATALNLPPDSQLVTNHDNNSPSDSGLKLESVPMKERLEDVLSSEHTDRGTLTLLFCSMFTTELYIPETGEWKFIVPKDRCAIVNVGDALQRSSGGRFMSCLHRVGQPVPGAGERICVLYYLRPSNKRSSPTSI